MRVGTLLGKFGAASVAGIITLGGGLAFAEVGEPTTTDTVVEEGETVTIPSDGGEVIAPTEGEVTPTEGEGGEVVVVEEGGSETGGEVIVVEESEVVVEEPVVKAHPENHGKYVSETAKTAPKGKGGVHGKAVSEVARSNQGKKHATEEAPATSAAKASGKAKGGKK
ncbi:MAG TPA: hypothetical protein VM938_02850 [Acidimicrobiales bacterium]|nr:hypothetical protein [Acidimicrobiales bacterium]